jgi:hypothetical protein
MKVSFNAEFGVEAEEESRADEQVPWGTMARSGASSCNPETTPL